ncbi:phosphate transport system ATP-binding protein [Candidatus Kryptonium thompsonii]|jgi:phosphate transport system ATP-binding protein|uniref:Phosphate transport system ATP-binding protein n=1 Tax=Candidatus Kryptonium thompsonii TaxID=1633631 RepID=A0A0P1P6A8_9BACT|nr:phosphate ABC transporter ATP-binding protein PstB [Candidatus Kryptonium thompsoni]CUS77000.1 phosphate transport system ATP-binding protein [Candidatus Kryptonium thompsoni]CUS78086.1 phosphate transport system ATP-binding protein [Candidatus Kryptonium thompsoni]CUS83806.1 phosphate transport system ATP-binding protein [Candidatus Kryptonium thompsoni]CUS87765.1 phosphate transport system ATP-binding protein [Candidatus Kryptonium thompsoni]CUS88183.1 phosphate transport system ATP-bindi
MSDIVLKTENLTASYDEHIVVKNVNLSIIRNKITAIMGPSGCGKTTLIRCFNRMHELSPKAKVEGKVLLIENSNEIIDVYSVDPMLVRRKIGMVFQKPNPFPTMSIYENVIAGYILNGIKLKKSEADEIVEESLKKVSLWDEVKDRLRKKGTFLSGGQQQRLCIARALAMKPDIILLDEPTSALDPVATAKIEELIEQLKDTVTIVIVTHNVGQAGRISDYVAFMYLGELVEYGPTDVIFTRPSHEKTEEFLTGKIG